MSRHAGQRPPRDRGAASAELVMVLPVLVVVTVGLAWLLSVGLAQMRAVDAARETARALARGDAEASARAVGQQVAPPGVALSIATADGRITVVAAAPVKGPGGLLGFLPAVTVRSHAVAVPEPS